MNNLLIFFALPLATIIISIALQKMLKCPFLVAGIIFATFLVVTFVIGNLTYLIATIVYTIISFITAVLMCLIGKLINRLNEFDNQQISSNCTNGNNDDLLIINSNSNQCECGNNIGRNRVSARINVIPNNNGNTGSICGCYKKKLT